MNAKLMLIHCLSPLHAGTGQGIGAVDLPIAREASTGLPYLPGSSIKGCLRDRSRSVSDKETTTIIFGPETDHASDHAGAIAFGDGQLVCLPTRSVHGTFAWVSSPFLMQRLLRNAHEAGIKDTPELKLLSELIKIPMDRAHIARTTSRLSSRSNKVYFEDLDFTGNPCTATEQLGNWLGKLLFSTPAEQELFTSRLAIVHDDALSFLTRHGIDTITRSSIDPDTKTVKDGQLWTEENLPTESILAALFVETPLLAKKLPQGAIAALEPLTVGSVQFGGHATIGRGRCAISLHGGKP